MTDTPSTGEPDADERGALIERFTASGSRILGVIVLVLAVIALADIVIEWRTRAGLTAAGVVIALGALVWMTMVRPVVLLYEHVLVMRNAILDVQIPWDEFEDVEVTPILTVKAKDGSLHRSAAIAAGGADRRAARRATRAQSERPSGRRSAMDRMGGAEQGMDPSRQIRPTDHIMSRMRSIAAKHSGSSSAASSAGASTGSSLGSPESSSRIQKRWAAPELAVFVVGVLLAILNAWVF